MLFACIVLSCLLFAGINITSVKKFGMQSCFSAYGPFWDAERKEHYDINVWSFFTIITALLIVPPMIELGALNPWQFLGFIAPLYLVLVAVTPYYAEDPKQNIVHQIGAWGCILFIMLWFIFVVGAWYIPVISQALAVALAYITKTKESITWWNEIGMYASVYFTLLFILP